MPRQVGTGCITCRVGRQCDGYLATSSTVTRRQLVVAARELSSLGPVARTLSQRPEFLEHSPSPDAISLFDFFRYATAPATASYFPTDFWAVSLLQLTHSEPAIWHAAIALGTLHRRWEESSEGEDVMAQPSPRRASLDRQALEHHIAAMSRAKDLNDPFKALILSLALAAISNIMGRWSEGRLHFAAAMRLVQTLPSDSVKPGAVEMMSRIQVQTMTFVDSSAPAPIEQAEWLTRFHRDLETAEKIDSYGQAATDLMAIMRRALLLDEVGTGGLPEGRNGPGEHELRRDLVNWERRMAVFERNNRSRRVEAATAIRLYHTLVRTILAAEVQGQEIRWDGLLGYFERVLACVDVLRSLHRESGVRRPFSLELGMTLPLYFVASQCRHPILRRRALSRLWELKSQEGVWNSVAAAAVAVRLICVEERTKTYVDMSLDDAPPLLADQILSSVPWEAWGMGDLRLPSQTVWQGVDVIPEEDRIRDTMLLVSLDDRTANLKMIMSSPKGKHLESPILEETVYF